MGSPLHYGHAYRVLHWPSVYCSGRRTYNHARVDLQWACHKHLPWSERARTWCTTVGGVLVPRTAA